ncbi:phytoene desaturase family protein [Candidatus Omnitrophota bacterium]
MAKKVAIVGAGVGGLATAARLACRGYQVEVYEKLPRCGGRANIIEDKGFKFDTGPSFVLMPDFFHEVFDYCGRNLEDYLDLRALDIGYRIFYADGRRLTVYHDKEKTKAELEKIEAGSARAYERFLSETGKIYGQVRNLLYSCFRSKDALNPSYWPLLFKIHPFASYWQFAGKFFRTPELRYAFTFEAMFIGVSPFHAPALYSIITYVDHVQKVFHPMGGMYRIPLALERLACESGARFFYDSEVAALGSRQGRVYLTAKGEELNADAAVINADYSYARSLLLDMPIPRFQYSCSVFLLYLGLKKKIQGLAHHNLFFARDLQLNLRNIFEDKLFPKEPSFYVHVPTVTDPSLAPEGKDLVYVLIPVPNLDRCRQDISGHAERLRSTVFEIVKRQTGVDIESIIEVEHRFYPSDFLDRYNVKYGATFGLAHTLMQSAFFRPANHDPRLGNIYFTGASTQPGGGLPPVIASSRIVADLITGGNGRSTA